MSFAERVADWRDRAVVRRTQVQRRLADISALNWRVETRELIESEVRRFAPRGHGRWVCMPAVAAGTTFQVDVHSDELLPKALGSLELDREGPASLVYSLHPNGSVAVIASSHSSAHAGQTKPDGASQSFVIDVVTHVWQLAGSAGRARVRRHLREFGKLATVTRAHARPTPASGRFLGRLAERADRFAFVFQSPGEARVHRLSQESNLGIGLIAGLIASTILPLARDYGKEVADRAAKTMEACKAGFPDGGDRLQACLKYRNYQNDMELAAFSSTGAVLLIALALTMVALWIVWRIKRQR